MNCYYSCFVHDVKLKSPLLLPKNNLTNFFSFSMTCVTFACYFSQQFHFVVRINCMNISFECLILLCTHWIHLKNTFPFIRPWTYYVHVFFLFNYCFEIQKLNEHLLYVSWNKPTFFSSIDSQLSSFFFFFSFFLVNGWPLKLWDDNDNI